MGETPWNLGIAPGTGTVISGSLVLGPYSGVKNSFFEVGKLNFPTPIVLRELE